MQRIELRVSNKFWVFYAIVISILGTGVLLYLADGLNITLSLYTAFIASALLVGTYIGHFSFFQKGVILTDSEIRKLGFPSKSIAYSEIQKITVSFGGYRIHGKGGGPINITRMYTGFNEANLLLNQKITDREEIKMIGLNFIVDMYFKDR